MKPTQGDELPNFTGAETQANDISDKEATAIAPEGIRAAPLGRHAAHGAAWSLLQTAGSKAVGVVSQLVLGYFLTQKSFGMAATALTITGFSAVTLKFGMTEVLVQRHKEFDRWQNAALRVSLVSGAISAALTMLAAPLAVWRYGNSTVGWLIALLAISTLGDSLSACPTAKLQVDLRFRTQSVVAIGGNILLAGLTVLFALTGFGPFAIILPRMIVSWVQAAVFWSLTGRPAGPRADGPWRALISDGAAVAGSNYLGNVIQCGDYLSLSLLRPLPVLGVYYFAYNMSTQMIQVMAANLGGALFAILSKLKDERERQAEAFLKASRVMCLLVMPFCVLQAAIAGPALRLLWGHRWDAAIPVLQILSIGMAFTVTAGGTTALIQSQGRFRFQLVWQAIVAATFLAFVVTGALLGEAISVSIAVCIFCISLNPIGTYMALRPARVPWRKLLPVYLKPFFYASVAIGFAEFLKWSMFHFIPSLIGLVTAWPERLNNFLECSAISLLSMLGYLVLVRIFSPRDAGTVQESVQMFTSRFTARKTSQKIAGGANV
jgi:PST family polysaccharide transporter